MSDVTTADDGFVDAIPPRPAYGGTPGQPRFNYPVWLAGVRARPGDWRKLPHTLAGGNVTTLRQRYPDFEWETRRNYDDPNGKRAMYDVYVRVKS